MAEKTLTETIEEIASLQFTDAEIARIIGVDVSDLLDEYIDNIDRGRLVAEAEVRRSVLKEAKNGSSTAQKQFIEFNRKAKTTRNKNNKTRG